MTESYGICEITTRCCIAKACFATDVPDLELASQLGYALAGALIFGAVCLSTLRRALLCLKSPKPEGHGVCRITARCRIAKEVCFATDPYVNCIHAHQQAVGVGEPRLGASVRVAYLARGV